MLFILNQIDKTEPPQTIDDMQYEGINKSVILSHGDMGVVFS